MAKEIQHRVRKPRFRRNVSWIAIRFIRPSTTDVHTPGDELPNTYRRHYLQYLWRRNCIGPKGDPWTEFMLQAHARHEERKTGKPVPAIATAPPSTSNPTPEPATPLTTGPVHQLELEEIEGGWYRITLGGKELAKTQGVDATNKWLEENGYEPAL